MDATAPRFSDCQIWYFAVVGGEYDVVVCIVTLAASSVGQLGAEPITSLVWFPQLAGTVKFARDGELVMLV